MSISRLHLNANVVGLAQNRGSEEHSQNRGNEEQFQQRGHLWLHLVPLREHRDVPIQWLGQERQAQWAWIPNPPRFGMLGSFPRDSGVDGSTRGWDLPSAGTDGDE